ncbi:hypothetical protein AYI69_g2484 [Smittium culicis]|uniref:Uncharacterized protein n=1 Tax=Smittium culicis TaxID=133412 RepID=A0A1R1YMF0_9FUNG|nr:hypothetical protein AYI69_g2484 [Smittium culicis]
MSKETNAKIQALSDKFDRLMQLMPVEEPEDRFVVTRPPTTDLSVYPEIFIALPSIEEDFFSTPLTEDERKDAIYSCPKSSSMNYQPPPLKDSSSAAVKKADTTLHGIQVALAQSTRPIDYYVHRRIQKTPEVTPEDPHIIFANTMRVLIVDITTTVTQGRLYNFHKGLDLPEKPQQLVEIVRNRRNAQEFASPFEGANRQVLKTVPSASLPRRRITKLQLRPLLPTVTRRHQIFAGGGAAEEGGPSRDYNRPPGRGASRDVSISLEKTHRQQVGQENRGERVLNPIQGPEPEIQEAAAQISADGTAAINITPATQQTKDQSRGPPDPDGGSRFAIIKNCRRGSSYQDSRVLQPPLRDSKEDRWTQTCFRSEEIKSSCRTVELQNGITRIDMQINSSEGLHEVLGSGGCIHAYPHSRVLQEIFEILLERKIISVQSTAIRTITKSAHFHQNPPPDFFMGENIGNPDFSILGQSADYSPSFQDQRPQKRGHENHESWDGDFEMSGEFHWKGTGHVYSPDAGTINVEKDLRAEERLPRQDEIMDIECYSDGTIDPESTILDQPAEIMEWFALPTREPRTGDIYRCQRHGMGDRCGLPILLGIVESLGGVDAHQRQEIINNIICTLAPECCRTLGISLLRQYHDISLRQEVLWNDFSRVSEDRGKHMEPLPGIKYPASRHIRAINFEPCGRAEQTDRSDRMVFIGPSIRESHNPIWGTRCRPVCIEGEQEGGSLLQLVSRQEIHGTERSRLQLDSLVQPLLLPALESNRPSSPDGETGAAEDHSDHPSLENRDMVPGPFAIVNRSTTPATSNICGSGSKKRKVSALQQQDMVPNGMEDQ